MSKRKRNDINEYAADHPDDSFQSSKKVPSVQQQHLLPSTDEEETHPQNKSETTTITDTPKSQPSVPVKEIVMIQGRSSSPQHNHNNNAFFLDPNTLQCVKQKVQQSWDQDFLDEDEVIHFGLKMDRLATDRLYEYNVMYGGTTTTTTTRGSDPIWTTATSDITDQALFSDFLQEEESHALGKELLQDSVAELTKQKINVDKGTISWIRRASGIHRSKNALDYPSSRHHRHHDDERAPPSRNNNSVKFTRKAARDRKDKQQNLGLEVLVDATKEFEATIQKYQEEKRKASRRKLAQAIDKPITTTTTTRHVQQSAGSNVVIASLSNDIQRSDTTYARGSPSASHVSTEEETEKSKAEREMLRKRKERKIREQKAVEKHLKSINLKESFYFDNEFEPLDPEEEISITSYKIREKRFGQAAKAAGYNVRLPGWTALCKDHRIPKEVLPDTSEDHQAIVDGIGPLFLDSVRKFARHEFFYSDIDREWYLDDIFSKAVHKLGVPFGARLSREEWRCLRKRITKKPRLFSKSFIASQIHDRNLYRCQVRRLQDDPSRRPPNGFDYNVIARIPVGATVTAFSSKHHILQRAVVMSYSKAERKYLVKFECSDFGFEEVPDTEVCCHGVLPLVFKRSSSMLSTDPSQEKAFSYILRHEDLPIEIESLQMKDVLSSFLCDNDENNAESVEDERQSLYDSIIEKESFLTLFQTFENALSRKQQILSTIREVVAGGSVRPDDANWLIANLSSTNVVLKEAQALCQLLYLNPWSEESSNESPRKECARLLDSPIIIRDLLGDDLFHKEKYREPWVMKSLSKLNDLANHLGQALNCSDFEKSRFRTLARAVGVIECVTRVQHKSSIGWQSLNRLVDAGLSDTGSLKFPLGPVNSFYETCRIEREDALEYLQRALSIFKAELALAVMTNHIQTM